jgi:hypothetical protein
MIQLQVPHQVHLPSMLYVPDSEMIYEKPMSGLEDLSVSTTRMQGVATYNATALLVRCSLEATVEQELVQPKDLVDNHVHKR